MHAQPLAELCGMAAALAALSRLFWGSTTTLAVGMQSLARLVHVERLSKNQLGAVVASQPLMDKSTHAGNRCSTLAAWHAAVSWRNSSWPGAPRCNFTQTAMETLERCPEKQQFWVFKNEKFKSKKLSPLSLRCWRAKIGRKLSGKTLFCHSC